MIGLSLARRVAGLRHRVPGFVVQQLGLPPAWVGYRSIRRETVREHFARRGSPADRSPDFQVLHPETVVRGPLPRNVSNPSDLADLASWWKFSFRDVAARPSAETFIATLRNCRVLHLVSNANKNKQYQFRPAILTPDDHSIELRELRFREEHIPLLRDAARVTTRIPKAIWFLEREYTNYAHWVTAHLPKLIYLKREGRLDDVIFPSWTNPAIDASLAVMGIRVADYRRVEERGILQVDELTVIGSDRFRPEMLRSVRDTFARPELGVQKRRIFISRSKAPRRRIVNDDAVWAVLEPHGFERVWMEELSFEEQVASMSSAAIVAAPHGAGLANIVYCAPGTHIVEFNSVAYPCPNFYAIATALDLPYWLVTATESGEGQTGFRDMDVAVNELRKAVEAIVASAS